MLALLLFFNIWAVTQALHPDAGLNIIQLTTKYGYPLESHEVTTIDGHVLTLHRIHQNSTTGPRRPILLMHGLLSSSVDWINLGPKRALGLLLADNGYDVWMGNHRGTTWSRKHVSIDPDLEPEKFFDFSYHEIGIYDLPAKIDYILGVTKVEKIFYVGHSQGSTAFFVMASEKPEYNSKIHLMTALAPVAYSSNIPNPFLPPLIESYGLIKVSFWNSEYPEYITELGNVLCEEGSIYQHYCVWFLNIIGGFNWAIEPDFIPVISSNAPAGCSIKQIQHYMQAIATASFAQYDYGITENQIRYNQNVPPHYDISKITAPVSLHYANNDWLNSVKDVLRLARELPNVAKIRRVPSLRFNHLDFLWAQNSVDLLYNDAIREINALI